MTESRTSTVAGLLTQGCCLSDYFESQEPLAVAFFSGQLLPVLFTQVAFGGAAAVDAWLVQADVALERFQKLGEAARYEATPLVLANYQQMLAEGGTEPLAVTVPTDIWRFVHPTRVTITRDGDEPTEDTTGDFFVQVECECDWEVEHGLLLVFREGRMLTRVSEQDGHLTDSFAYDQSEEEDPLMMQYYATYGRPAKY